MDELINEIKKVLTNTSLAEQEDYLSMNKRYEPILLSRLNFHEIKSLETSTTSTDTLENKSKKVLFVDGGNSILFESASFSIGFIRVCALVYSGNKRIARHTKELYILIKEEDGLYKIKTFPESTFNELTFNPEDETLRNGLEKSNCGRIISVIRRFCELEFAYEKNNDDIDFILLDGTLEAAYPYEKNYLNKILLTGKVVAVSKTCSLTTKSGISITKKLYDMNGGEWYYYPIVINNNPNHDAEIYFTKLNKRSEYVFRIELQQEFKQHGFKQKESDNSIEELFSILKNNSLDPIFLGYPYGLIDVDNMARVTEEEKNMLKTQIMHKLGRDWIDFSKNLNSLNAHDILDKIKF